MCPNNTTTNSQHTHNSRNSRRASHRLETPTSWTAEDADAAVDDPPPVILRHSRGQTAATAVSCRQQTPQHMATLTAPTISSALAPPLVLRQKYFVWGLAEGKIALWTSKQFLTALSSTSSVANPAVVLETHASTPWVQMTPYPSLSADEKNGSTLPCEEMLCLTSGGVFYHVKLRVGDVLHSEMVQLETLRTWHTKRPGAACFGMTKSHCVVVGYQNGIVEAWREGKHLWTGHFEAYPGVRSIVALETESDHEYVLLTLEPKDRASTDRTMEVICLTAVEENQKPDDNTLEDYWVLPQAGCEVLDATALSDTYRRETSHRFATHWIPSHGAHVATNLPAGSKCQIMVEVADGSVLFLDAVNGSGIGTDESRDSEEVVWGVSPQNGQFLLSFPSVGRGVVTIKGKQFVACALRGGTVYLFPLCTESSATTDAPHDEEILSTHYPDDISRDSSVQQLQDFVAADVELSVMGDTQPGSFPLLFFCWPGGIVDVYCAHLLPSSDETYEDFAPLMENGAVDELCRLLRDLSSSSDPDNLLSDPLWSKSRDEIQAAVKTNETSMTLQDIGSRQFLSFRRLLRQLADPDKPTPVTSG